MSALPTPLLRRFVPRRLHQQLALLVAALALLALAGAAAPLWWAGGGPGHPLRPGWLALELGLAIGAVWWVVRRGLRPLERVIAFAGELGRSPGARLELRAGSAELRALADALNEASRLLAEQMRRQRQAEERVRALVDAVPDVFISLDPEGRVSLVNQALASVFGAEPQRLVGRDLAELLPGLDAQAIERHLAGGMLIRASGAQVARFEARAVRHGGTEFPVDVTLSRLQTSDGPVTAALLRDVTEQRMAESMMNLFSRALECTSNGVLISDMTLPGQPVFYANPAFQRITGYAPHEAIGRNCGFLQREDTQQPELDEIRAAVRERRGTRVVLRNYRKDGSLFFNELSIAPVDEADGGLRYYVGVVDDVTERERARMAIAERSARLDAVFDLSPDGFVVFDREGRLAYGNAAFRAMTGWGADGATAMPTLAEFDRWFARLCDPAQPAPEPVSGLLARGPGDAVPQIVQVVRPERRVLARMARRAGVGHDDGGESILFLRDITRETEVDRMKTEFLTTAAHELRTPMVSVFGFTELLLRRPVPEPKRRDMLEIIHRQASLLIDLVNELLDLARIEARQGKDLRREPCSVAGLVTQAAGPLAIDGRHDLRVEVRHGERLLHVDPEKTLRALTNVLSNAVKYSAPGSPIRIASALGEVHGVPAVGLSVADRGIGMSPAQLARVFERFWRADPSGNVPGTGLGMCLVKEIVELQHGRVDVDSAPGEGTTVTLWLPLAEAPAPSPQAAAAPRTDTDNDTEAASPGG